MSSVSHVNPAQTALAAYAVNNVEDSNPLYVGKVRSDGNWVVERYDTTDGTYRYANHSNNQATIGYGAAWTTRASLTYSLFDQLAGL